MGVVILPKRARECCLIEGNHVNSTCSSFFFKYPLPMFFKSIHTTYLGNYSMSHIARFTHSEIHKIETTNLILRPIKTGEVSQFRTIRSEPKNNDFEAIPDPLTRERSLALGLKYAAEQGIIDLFVIVKTPDHTKHEEFMVDEGLVIGVMQICPPDPESGEMASEVGGYIHHEFTGKGYGKEAFGATIGYVLEDLEREEVVLETKSGNLGFRGLMRSLGLEGLQGPGKAWTSGKSKEKGGEDASIRWEFGRKEWEDAKRGIL